MHHLVSRTLATLGLLLLLMAVASPWMEVPSGFRLGPDGEVACTTLRPGSELFFRSGCLAFAATIAVGRWRHPRAGSRRAVLAASALAALLSFPCLVMDFEPALSARASWLHIQHENLTWLGGDLFTNLEYSRDSWKDRIYLVETPRQVAVVRMPPSSLAAFQLGRLATWFETLGYSNRFCQFVRSGWAAALCGMGLLVLGECLPEGRPHRRRLALALAAGVATCLAWVGAAAVPVVVASQRLEQARRATARGLYDEAAASLDRAAAILPALGEDTSYVAQRGLLDFRRGRGDSPAGRLFHANLLERQGRQGQATLAYRALFASEVRGSAVHREALRALLREGTCALNAGRTDGAIATLEEVLAEDPCNLKANYALQLAYLRADRPADLADLVRRLEATYAHFQMPTKAIVLASSHENEMMAALRGGDADATFGHSIGAKRP